MLALAMFHAITVALLLTVAGFAAERLVVADGRPRRAVWLGVVLLSLLFPLVSAARRAAPWRAETSGATSSVAGGAGGAVLLDAVQVVAGVPSRARAYDVVAALTPWLAAAWGMVTVLLLVRIALSLGMVRRMRRSWQPATVDGQHVLVSDDAGPALVGVRDVAIVLPRWSLDLDAPLRALVLQHEAEHRRARDPLLLAATTLLVALLPWHVVLLWQVRRLRLAVELDCDARVLRALPQQERYGMLLLTVAQRSTGPFLARAAMALVESSSTLARRIHAMQRPTALRRERTLLLAAFVGFTVNLACSMRAPQSPRAADTATRASTGSSGATIREGGQASPAVPPNVYFEFQVDQAVTPAPGNRAPQYPPELRTAGTQGEVLVQFVVDTLGRAEMTTFRVLRSVHGQFTESVRVHVPTMQFVPAQKGGTKVRQLVQMPFSFSLSR